MPTSALRHRLAGIGCLFDKVAVAELRVILVSIEQGIGAIRLDDLSVGDGIGPPAVVRLAGELEYPARHRDGDPIGGELTYERVEPFPGRLACDR